MSGIPVIEPLGPVDPEFLRYMDNETTDNVATSHLEIPAERELWMTSGHSFPVVTPVKLCLPSAEELQKKLDNVQKTSEELKLKLDNAHHTVCELKELQSDLMSLQSEMLQVNHYYYFSYITFILLFIFIFKEFVSHRNLVMHHLHRIMANQDEVKMGQHQQFLHFLAIIQSGQDFLSNLYSKLNKQE